MTFLHNYLSKIIMHDLSLFFSFVFKSRYLFWKTRSEFNILFFFLFSFLYTGDGCTFVQYITFCHGHVTLKYYIARWCMNWHCHLIRDTYPTHYCTHDKILTDRKRNYSFMEIIELHSTGPNTVNLLLQHVFVWYIIWKHTYTYVFILYV